MIPLTPELLLRAYAVGVFPMAQTAEADDVMWFDPQQRGIIPLDRFHLPRRLLKTVRAGPYTIRLNTAFSTVIERCAEQTERRKDTWINPSIMDAFTALHDMGHAHSVEAWEGDTLVGGLYGLAINGAFFGESMFTRRRDASKVALAHLIGRLIFGGFSLLDTQFVNPHLEQFGATEVPRKSYRQILQGAMQRPHARFLKATEAEALDALMALC